MIVLDETHDPKRRSWVDTANLPDADFPIQNLPVAVFRRAGTAEPWRGGVAIGDQVLDLAALGVVRQLTGRAGEAVAAAAEAPLNRFMGLGAGHWTALRRALGQLLEAGSAAERAAITGCLVPQAEASLAVPAAVGDYSDFFTSYNHALNGGRINRPNQLLPPSFKFIPIGYHGRSSTIVVSGTPVRRPLVQTREGDRELPEFGPSRMIDYEAELAFYVGPGSTHGEPVPIDRIQDHLFGCTILNDWSARDTQRWETAVAGPLLAKDWATSVSPWVVSMDALRPFRLAPPARPDGDPSPLPYLDGRFEREAGALDITIEVWLSTATMRERGQGPQRLSRGSFRDQYFTIGQMTTHHASNGCSLRPGDIIGSGTISNESPDSWGSMMELTKRAREPITVGEGESRGFLEDGDEVIMRAYCVRDGFVRIGFGECRGRLLPSPR